MESPLPREILDNIEETKKEILRFLFLYPYATQADNERAWNALTKLAEFSFEKGKEKASSSPSRSHGNPSKSRSSSGGAEVEEFVEAIGRICTKAGLMAIYTSAPIPEASDLVVYTEPAMLNEILRIRFVPGEDIPRMVRADLKLLEKWERGEM